MKEWGTTPSQRNKRLNKVISCSRKKPFKTQGDAEAFARGQARRELRTGMVHQFRAYECTVSDPTHWHLTTYGDIFAVGYKGSLDARGWAEHLGCKWTDEDDAACAAVLRKWEDDEREEIAAHSNSSRFRG